MNEYISAELASPLYGTKDTLKIPGMSGRIPPKCPNDWCLLTPTNANKAGDTLFECLSCGYQAIHRAGTDSFEKPSWWTKEWKPCGKILNLLLGEGAKDGGTLFVTVAEAARMTGLTETQVRSRMNDGTFASIKEGRRVMVSTVSLAEFVAAQDAKREGM